jgi:hypothetical protein
MTQAGKVQMFDSLRRRTTDGALDLPDDPLVRSDLLGVRKWIAKNGAFSIELERQGGRHSDHAQSVALVVAKAATSTPGWLRAATKWGERKAARERAPETRAIKAKSDPFAAIEERLAKLREENARPPRCAIYHEPPDISVLEDDWNPPRVARWSRGDRSSPIQFSANCDAAFKRYAEQTRAKGA